MGRIIGVLFTALVLSATGCGGSSEESPHWSGSDAEETAPQEAQDVIVDALATMFTWHPTTDSSTLDAYQRALPYLGPELQAGKDNRVERGNSVWWQEWMQAEAEVTADALLVAGEHPADEADRVERAVRLTQMVVDPTGNELDSIVMDIPRVVAEQTADGWRVVEISFFPVNEYRTQACPPGQSHQPPPDGPCAPNPPPPQKVCPDGSTVAPDQLCPSAPPPTTPRTKQCPDGSTVPADQSCPTPTTPPPVTTTTTTAPPVTCPDGSTVSAGETCPPVEPPTVACPDGSSVLVGEQCPRIPVSCPDGTTVYPPQTCPVAPRTPKSSVIVLPPATANTPTSAIPPVR
ncbi:hypothetical protein JDV09_11795 [Mycobacterium sp. Y57]|uniref:hypothetical protein n=1 Tax=Mycolicibacterium xanthum TaxID=2796469 RepID=UPI001C854D39|nr:hypothetical protein [Mycolicibacterium xanthum]MBX7432782.1 hypothetical protein [Mycolicibacterium xanthum]